MMDDADADEIDLEEAHWRVGELIEARDLAEHESYFKSLGPDTVPLLLDALRDPRVARPAMRGARRTPLDAIVGILQEHLPPEAVPLLRPFSASSDAKQRARAGFLLARIATAEAIPLVLALLDDSDAGACDWTCMGLEHAANEHRLRQQDSSLLYDALLARFADAACPDRIPVTLINLDRTRAQRDLAEPRFLSPTFPGFGAVLHALASESAQVDSGTVRSLFELLAPVATDYPGDTYFGDALSIYARNPDVSTAAYLTESLRHPSPKVRREAASALGILFGTQRPAGHVGSLMQEFGEASLSRPQILLYCAHEYFWWTTEQGHEGYFRTNYAGDADLARRGLIELGAPKLAGILARACAVFPGGEPPHDHDGRLSLLRGLRRSARTTLKALDQEFNQAGEDVIALEEVYATRHSDHFRKTHAGDTPGT